MSLTKQIEFDVTKSIRVFYHKRCWDGAVAASVAERYFLESFGKAYVEKIDFIPVQYGDFFHETQWQSLQGNRIYILDFSFPRETMERLQSIATHFVCLDHHVTAQKNLEGIAGCIFNMELSGAGMAWKYFFQYDCCTTPESVEKLKGATHSKIHDSEEYPYLVWLTQDYDIWKFYGGTNTKVFSLARSLWDIEDRNSCADYFNNDFLSDFIADNFSAYRLQQEQIKRIADTAYTVSLPVGVLNVKVVFFVNPDPSLTGVVSEYLYTKHGLVVMSINPKHLCSEKIVVSFRADTSRGHDCTPIVTYFGGGGHKGAGGCTMDTDFLLKVIREKVE